MNSSMNLQRAPRAARMWLTAVALAVAAPALGTTLTGAGSSFAYPLYTKWASEYAKVKPDLEINYQPIGSGGGIAQITARTVDFGATDGPMSTKQLFAVNGTILHIPTALGGVVVMYNLPGVDAQLNFTGEVLAKIYLGQIKKWNDPAIAGLNAGVNLPDMDITVTHRSDGSGTTYCFVDYLCKLSAAWKAKVGKGTSVNWPVGLGGKGSEGVSGLVKQTPGAIGYVELIYADQNHIAYGLVKNRAGKFVKATLETVSAAAAGVRMPDDFRVSITDADGDNAYPISTFTWILAYTSYSGDTGTTLKMFLRWALKDGQAMAATLDYAPLPDAVRDKVAKAVEEIG